MTLVRRADFLLAWQYLVALGVLLVNDFVLKRAYPGQVSGFASDAAGVVFFPITLVVVVELFARLLPAGPYARPSWFAATTALVAVGFVLVKTTDWAETVYESLATPLDAALGTRFGVHGIGVVRDHSDLLALLLVPIPVWVGVTWRGRRTQPPERDESDGLDAGATR